MFLPVGHDQGLRRFPWLTAAIVAVCVLVQTHQTLFGVKRSEFLQVLSERATIEEAAVRTFGKVMARKAWEAARREGGGELEQREALSAALGSLVESFRSGLLTGPDHPLYQQWLETIEREKELRERNLGARLAYHPDEGPSWKLLGSAFGHAGWAHLLGNMLFLYLVGCNLEDRWGRLVFAMLFAAGAVASALVFGAVHRWSGPGVLGASGAIAACMGAFLICFFRARIQLLVWYRSWTPRIVEVDAFWALPAWFLAQLLWALVESRRGGSVAYSAHVGGFVFGVLVAAFLKVTSIEKRWLLPATAKGVEWHEDPSFLRALDHIQKGSLSSAVPLLQTVVKKNPRHEAAWENLARVGIRLSDSRLVNRALPAYGGLLPRDRLPNLVALMREIRLADTRLKLDDRALFTLLRATDSVNDAGTGLQIVQRLLEDFPQSPTLPRALWLLANLQEAAGRSDLATATLGDLVKRFPKDTLALQAQDKLDQPAGPVSVPAAKVARAHHTPQPIALPDAQPEDLARFEIERSDAQPAPEVRIAELPDIARGARDISQNPSGTPPAVPPRRRP